MNKPKVRDDDHLLYLQRTCKNFDSQNCKSCYLCSKFICKICGRSICECSPSDSPIQTLEKIIISSEKSKGSKKDLLLRLLGYITALKAEERNDNYCPQCERFWNEKGYKNYSYGEGHPEMLCAECKKCPKCGSLRQTDPYTGSLSCLNKECVYREQIESEGEVEAPYPHEYLILKKELKKKLMELNIKKYTSEFWKYKMKIVSNYPFWEKVLNDDALPFFNDLGDKLTEIFSSFRNDLIKQLEEEK